VSPAQTLLTEMARIRAHGFSEREVAIARAKLMADIESSYLEREQSYATDVRDEYTRHFLHGATASVNQHHDEQSCRPLFKAGVKLSCERSCRLSQAMRPSCTMSCILSAFCSSTISHDQLSARSFNWALGVTPCSRCHACLCAGEFVVGQEYEARLSKALLPRVTMAHLQRLVDLCSTAQSCVIKTLSHRR